MSLNSLFVPAATQNPLRVERLPNTEPTLLLPVEDLGYPQRRRLALKNLLRLFLGSLFFAALFAVPKDALLGTGSTSNALFTIGFIYIAMGLGDRVGRYWFPLLLLLFARWFFDPQEHFFIVTGTAIALNLAFGLCFFIQTWLLRRPNVFVRTSDEQPKRRHFGRAIIDWLSYNTRERRAPGLVVSALPYRWRMILTALTLTVNSALAICVPLPEFSASETSEWLPFALKPFGGMVSLWILTLVCEGGLRVINYGRRGFRSALSIAEDWWDYLEFQRNSADRLERQSLFLGFVAGDGSPILYPAENLMRHAWIVGSSGSGKTVQLISLVEQLIYRFETSVIYIDLKAMTNEVLETMRSASKRAESLYGLRRPLSHFTLAHGDSSYLLDIFSQPWWTTFSADKRTGVLLSAMSLAYSRA